MLAAAVMDYMEYPASRGIMISAMTLMLLSLITAVLERCFVHNDVH